MKQTSAYEPLPAEFAGCARKFIAAQPTGMCLTKAIEALDKPLKRGGIRREVLAGVCQYYRTPRPSCLWSRVRPNRTRTEFRIEALEMCQDRIAMPSWMGFDPRDFNAHNSEAAIDLIGITATISRNNASWQRGLLGSVGAHAIGRWYQRAWSNQEANLRRDLCQIAATIPDMDLPDREDGVPIRVDTLDAGCWVGELTHVQGFDAELGELQRLPVWVVRVRTYLGHTILQPTVAEAARQLQAA